MVETGTYEELLACSSSFSSLLENIHQQEQEQHEHEHPTDIPSGRLTRCVTFLENDYEGVALIDSQNFETKKEGSVKWHVYIAYLRAGAGFIFGVLLLILVFGFYDVALISYSWWLAKWNDDESHRHRQLNNCTRMLDQKINMIRSMNSTEWNNYRNNRFYVYCGQSMCSGSLFYFILLFFFV